MTTNKTVEMLQLKRTKLFIKRTKDCRPERKMTLNYIGDPIAINSATRLSRHNALFRQVNLISSQVYTISIFKGTVCPSLDNCDIAWFPANLRLL